MVVYHKCNNNIVYHKCNKIVYLYGSITINVIK